MHVNNSIQMLIDDTNIIQIQSELQLNSLTKSLTKHSRSQSYSHSYSHSYSYSCVTEQIFGLFTCNDA